MNRREFLKAGALVSLSSLMPGLSGWAYSTANPDATAGKKLVVIFLRGAADGLNIVIPYSDPGYYSARKTIAVPRPGTVGGGLKLDADFALHPALAPLMPYWQNKSLAFVHASGSPDPTRSHFDAQDYMESGCPGVKVVSSGWMNRLLEEIPDTGSPLRAVSIGSTMPRILQGPEQVASYAPKAKWRRSAVDIPRVADAFKQMYANRNDALGQAFTDGMESHIMLKDKLSEEMIAANKGAPPANKFQGFGMQLGKLMGEDPKIQVAFVAIGGWDTHVNQGADKGQLANHLTVVGKGLDDLAKGLGPKLKDTTIIVMSEFGRTVKENGNRGTDHGHGNVMWLMGGGINGGKVHGRWDGLANSRLFEGRDLPVTTDFRTVLASVTAENLKLSSKSVNKVFPDFNFQDKSLAGILKA